MAYTGKHGKRNTNGKQRFEDKTKTRERYTPASKEKANDPEWYIRQGQLAKDVASFSFNNALGAKCYLDGDNANGDIQFTSANQAIPGIMVIHTAPAVNPSTDESSPINLAAKNLYTYVRHQNSGHSNYESSDMMMYIMAMDSIYSFSAWMTRIYGTLRTYSQVNRFIGPNMVVSMGVDPNDIMGNLADFRAYINIFNTKASAFCTPNTMSLFKRHWWMYSSIFADADVAKAQCYIYNPAFLWTWVEASGAPAYLDLLDVGCTKTGSQFSSRTSNSSSLKLSDIKTIGNTLLGALVGSEDINIMSGDILKAYGRENVWSLGLVAEDYSVVPIYSEEILDQIHNTIFTGNTFVQKQSAAPGYTATGGVNTLRLTQATSAALTDYLVYQPVMLNAQHLCHDHFLDMWEADPSPERVLVASRNMLHGYANASTDSGAANNIVTLDSAGSDICLFGTIWYGDPSSGYFGMSYMNLWNIEVFTINSTSQHKYEKFARAPLIYYFSSNTSHQISPVLGEINNYTIVNFHDLNKMHESAMLSMMGVPV